jgi:hypothetical protein
MGLVHIVRHPAPPIAWIRLLGETEDTSTSVSQSSQSSLDSLSSPGFIAWYCFLVFCLAATCVCCCWHCGRNRWQHYQLERIVVRNEREALAQAVRELEISRIEANVQMFSEQQTKRKRRWLMKTLCGQRVVS